MIITHVNGVLGRERKLMLGRMYWFRHSLSYKTVVSFCKEETSWDELHHSEASTPKLIFLLGFFSTLS